MSEPVAATPTFLSIVKGLLFGCLTRRRVAPRSVSPPDDLALNANPVPLESTDTQDQGVETYDASSHIDDAQRSHANAGRLGSNTRTAVEVAESPETWEAASTTVKLFNDVVSGLNLFSHILDTVSEISPFVKAAVGVINVIVKPVINQDVRDEAFEELLRTMLATYALVKKKFDPTLPVQTSGQEHSVLLIKIFGESEKCANFIKNEYTAQNFWNRAARNALRGGHVDATIARFSASFKNLREEWHEATLIYLAVQRTLDQLKPSQNVGHNSLRACLPETRLDLLRDISERIRAGTSRPVFVVGVAGSGKSSIAHSIAVEFEKTAELGCFFQFDRSEKDRTASRLIPTIAHALAVRNEAYRTAVVRVLQTTPSLATTNDITVQWRCLIQEAGSFLSGTSTLLLVVDAFDECPKDDFGTHERLLELLTSRVGDLPANIRVLVTFRPLPTVAEAIASATCVDVASVSATDDIRRYVRHQLPGPERAGLDDAECNSVADAAEGLFQWAATACRFIKDSSGVTTVHESFMFHVKRRTLARRSSLDSLYAAVLSASFDAENDIAMGRYRSVVAMMLSATSPLSKAALQLMYQLATEPVGPVEHRIVESVINRLGVVITGTTSSNLPVRPMHTSFQDFLSDRTRSREWHISPENILQGHCLLALGALRHQARELAFNMCGFPSSCSKNAEITDLRSRLDSLPTALEYSACFWEHHVAVVFEAEAEVDAALSHAQDAIRVPLRAMLLQRFLFWLELLSLCGRVEHAAKSLSTALKVFQGEQDADMREFVADAAIFARHFCFAMSRSAPHIYLSALPFSPSSSLIRRQFMTLFPGLPVASPLLPYWPIARDRISYVESGPGEWVYCVLCTPDLRLIAGGGDGKVRIGNAENPADPPSYLSLDLEPGVEERSSVHAIAYSQDCHSIAAGHANGCIALWDSIARKLRRRLTGHTGVVTSVAFSPNEPEKCLISGSQDSMVICWNHSHGTILHRLEGHDTAVSGVLFAPDGRRIYSSSWDQTVRVWDLTTGQPGGDLLQCRKSATCLSYSPERRCMAVGVFSRRAWGGDDSTSPPGPCIQLWDVDSHRKVGELYGHNEVMSVAWSPDGRFIASASNSGMNICLWDATELRLIGEPLEGSTGGVTGVSFSPDGQTLFSSACDCNIRVWNVASIGRAEQRQMGAVSRLSYSLDGHYIRADYDSGQVRCWETRLGAPVPTPVDVDWRTPTTSSSPDDPVSVCLTRDEIILEDRRLDDQRFTLFRLENGVFVGDLLVDRRRLAVSCRWTPIRVWDLETRNELCPSIGLGAACNCLSLSPDGTEVASGMYDSTVRIWPIDNGLGHNDKYPYANFIPQATVDEHGVTYHDASLRCTKPDIDIPQEYVPSMWRPRMRLLLNVEPLSVDFSNACYGTDWAKCYSGNLPAATLEEVSD